MVNIVSGLGAFLVQKAESHPLKFKAQTKALRCKGLS